MARLPCPQGDREVPKAEGYTQGGKQIDGSASMSPRGQRGAKGRGSSCERMGGTKAGLAPSNSKFHRAAQHGVQMPACCTRVHSARVLHGVHSARVLLRVNSCSVHSARVLLRVYNLRKRADHALLESWQ
eukprot:1160787-Pelagomonas_calceolata.AAC.13